MASWSKDEAAELIEFHQAAMERFQEYRDLDMPNMPNVAAIYAAYAIAFERFGRIIGFEFDNMIDVSGKGAQ